MWGVGEGCGTHGESAPFIMVEPHAPRLVTLYFPGLDLSSIVCSWPGYVIPAKGLRACTGAQQQCAALPFVGSVLLVRRRRPSRSA